MKNLFKNSILMGLLAASPLLAASNNNNASPLNPQNFVNPNENQQKQGGFGDLQTNKFYLEMDTEQIKNIQQRDKEVKDALHQWSQKEVNHKPVIRPISSMDTISLHPYFTHTLLLPQGSTISYVDSSVAMAVLKYENNVLMLRPNSDFDIANITVVYKLNDTNRVINILAERYTYDNGDKLNQVISYKDINKKDDLYVIDAYLKEFGELPKDDFNYIKIDGVDYRIVRDDKYGNITVQNKTYRVDNNVIYK